MSPNHDNSACSCVLPLFVKLSQTISSGKNMHEIMAVAVELIAENLESAERVVLGIICRHTETLFIQNGWGLSELEQSRGVYRLGEGVTGQVALSGEPVIIPVIADESAFLDRTGARKGRDTSRLAFICVPIKLAHEVLGTLSVDRPTAAAWKLGEDRDFLTIIATMIAQAVQLQRMRNEENEQLRKENRRLQNELVSRYRPENIIGNSNVMQSLYSLIQKVSSKTTPVLLLGESGTGKELIASALHYSSPRHNKAFIRFNCAAIPENLAESEIFGHEKGSFTGASAQRKGKFEEADGGTLFMDEVGELSLGLQAKLLRILQSHEFERVGGNTTLRVDVRLLAATNRDLAAAVKEGTFREDLYYRLNVFPLMVPPLRERESDILLLADYFVEKYANLNSIPVRRISTLAIDALMAYHWPGNVRELENVIERALILSDDGVIHAFHLPPTLQTPATSGTAYHGSLEQRLATVEQELIIEALKTNRGNMAAAARELGLSERVIALRSKQYGLDFRNFRR